MTDFTDTACNLTAKLQQMIADTGLQNTSTPGPTMFALTDAIKKYLDATNRPTFYEIAQAVMDSNTENNCIFQVDTIEKCDDLGWICRGVVIRRAAIFQKSWGVTSDLKVTEQ